MHWSRQRNGYIDEADPLSNQQRVFVKKVPLSVFVSFRAPTTITSTSSEGQQKITTQTNFLIGQDVGKKFTKSGGYSPTCAKLEETVKTNESLETIIVIIVIIEIA